MKINIMNQHYHMINEEMPKIIEQVKNKMSKNHPDKKFETQSWYYYRKLIRIDEEKQSFLNLITYQKTTPIFRIWYNGLTHSYNCSFTDENYDIIFPIINKYSYILDDVFIYNTGDDESI